MRQVGLAHLMRERYVVRWMSYAVREKYVDERENSDINYLPVRNQIRAERERGGPTLPRGTRSSRNASGGTRSLGVRVWGAGCRV